MVIYFAEFLIAGVILLCCFRALNYIFSWKDLPVAENVDKESPLISIVIPARNEEKSIERCLDSLSKQIYQNLEIIVMNDLSTDHTADVVRTFIQRDTRIKLINNESLPDGWLGKSWALYQGTKVAKGDWILFSDADVVHNPLTVNSVYQYAHQNGIDFLTMKYTLIVKSFWEKVFPPFVDMAKAWFGPSLKGVNEMNTSLVAARGDFVFVKRSSYEKVGGHQVIKDEIIESGALMRVFKEARYKTILLNGSHLIRTRKYNSLREIIHSYSKFFCRTIRREKNTLFFSKAFLIFVIMVVFLHLIPIGSLCKFLFFGAAAFDLNTLLWPILPNTILFFETAIFYKKNGFKLLYALGFPLGAMALICMYCNALFTVGKGQGVSWRGRVY